MYKYEMIAEEIQKKIKDGTYPPDTRLPQEMEMCKIYDASRITIREAMELHPSTRRLYARAVERPNEVRPLRAYTLELVRIPQPSAGLLGRETGLALRASSSHNRAREQSALPDRPRPRAIRAM